MVNCLYCFMLVYSALCPVAAVQIAVTNGFGYVLRLYVFGSGEVGDGACHFQDAVIGAGGERELLHGCAQESDGLFVWFGKLMNHALGHLRVAVDAAIFLEACRLDVACLDDTLTDGCAWFARL